jgi:O-antigen/teichoic acid export membrane protein
MSRLDLFVLAAFVPAGTVGVYAATCEVAWVMKDIRQSFDPIFAPVASGLLHEGQRERLSALFASVTRWILILELAFLLGAILWGSAVLSIFGRSFPVGFASLLLLSAGFAINGAFGLSEVLLLMGGRSGLNLLNTVLLAAVNLALNLTLVPRYGIEGAALSSAGSLTLINIVRVVQGRVLLGVHPFRRSLLKPLVAAGVATGVGLALVRLENPWSVASILSLPLYFGLLRALGLEEADHEMLEKLHARAPFLRRWALAWDRLGTRLNRIRPRRVPAPSRPADRDRPDDPSERPPSS